MEMTTLTSCNSILSVRKEMMKRTKGYLKQMPMLRGNMIQQVSVDLRRADRTYLQKKKVINIQSTTC